MRVQRHDAEFASLVLTKPGYDCDVEHLQANAELQLEAALLQLSSLQEQKEQMQRLHRDLARQGSLVPYAQAYAGIGAEGAMRLAVFATHEAEQLTNLLQRLGRLIQS